MMLCFKGEFLSVVHLKHQQVAVEPEPFTETSDMEKFSRGLMATLILEIGLRLRLPGPCLPVWRAELSWLLTHAIGYLQVMRSPL